jgi:hypothetical protein
MCKPKLEAISLKTQAMLRFRDSSVIASALLAGSLWLSLSAQNRIQPSIEFAVVPPASNGNPTRIEIIAGRVQGALPGQRIVLFAQSGEWWVQPHVGRPFTDIQPDSRWKGFTHPGTAYAALLVDSQYVPPPKMNDLPERGGSILAVATIKGAPSLPSPPSKVIQFSGYPWKVREAGRDNGYEINFYDPANAWTDQSGFLHLRISGHPGEWQCAEVSLTRSLGYGSYRFVVRDVSHLEPATVLIVGPSSKMAIELSRWGRPEDKNTQYVITPFDVPANVVRFIAPGRTLTHWMDWQPGRVTFQTVRGKPSKAGPGNIAEHAFTSGVQSPGSERISFNLYFLDSQRNPLQRPVEVIIEKFQFLP